MNIPTQFDTAEFRQTLVEFTTMRKKIRKPATDHALSLIFAKLSVWCGDDVAKAIAILNQSIENSWQGVFPLKSAQINGKKQSEMPKICNGLDDAPIYTNEEMSKHIADLLRAIEKPEVEDESIPF